MEELRGRVAARRVINTVTGSFLLPKYQPYQSMYQPYISSYRPTNMRRYLATLKDVIPSRYPSEGLSSSLKRKKYRKVIKKKTFSPAFDCFLELLLYLST